MSTAARTEELARQVLSENRVAIYLVAYNAERHIAKVLSRIPRWVAQRVCEIYVIDDHSKDETVRTVEEIRWPSDFAPLKVFQTPYNQGYGGNQRLGYRYAIEKKFDIVILLHADGQYAPEALPEILAAYGGGADAVFGSRFINSVDALRGRMPLYKWLGNRVLTRIQNALLKSKMSEMHSGYRSYRTHALKRIPFEYNSLGFDFDADIIVQFLALGMKIVEVPIPTYYGDEICHVNGLQYAWACVKTAVKYRLMQFEIFYDPKFDFRVDGKTAYSVKLAPTSLHYFIRNLKLAPGTRILDAGGGSGEAVSLFHAAQGASVTCIDQHCDPADRRLRQFQVDLNKPWKAQMPDDTGFQNYEVVFALDVLEHLLSPERGAREIFESMKVGGKLYASTGNVAFLPLRGMLLLGQFNYGRRGILDLTHTRLFTISTFQRLLKNAGFKVDRVRGFGPPLSDLASRSSVVSFLDRFFSYMARHWPRLFAFQVLLECTRVDSFQELMKRSFSERPRLERENGSGVELPL